MTTTLDDLIARLEKAEGPDRELDADIALAVLGGEIVWTLPPNAIEHRLHRRYASTMHIGGYGNEPIAEYTASIDAALTLVPEGWGWVVEDADLGCRGCCRSADFDCETYTAGDETRLAWERGHNIWVVASTPALALCIAALKARKTEAAA